MLIVGLEFGFEMCWILWVCVTSEWFCGLWETVDLNGCVLIKLKLSLCYGVIMGCFFQVLCESPPFFVVLRVLLIEQ